MTQPGGWHSSYIFPELHVERRVQNGDKIRLSSLRGLQRALQRMYEDSGYWAGRDCIDKTTEENVFITLSWHIVSASGREITIKPVDESVDCRNMGLFSYSYQGEYSGEEGTVHNSRVHGWRQGCIAPGDRLQISFPSVWEQAHNAVIRSIAYAGNNQLRLTLDRSTEGIKTSTHPRYKIGNEFEIYHATITDAPYQFSEDEEDIKWTTTTTWAIDGALVATTTRRIIPHSWYQISPRTKMRGCKFCLCDHSNSVANLASSGVAIDGTGRHWYCAKRKYFTETFVPYTGEQSQGGGQYTYEWKTPSGLPNFAPDCYLCKDSEGKACDCYESSYDDGNNEPVNWSKFDECRHLCRVLDDVWEGVPCYLETFLDPPFPAVFRYKCVGTPSLLSQRKMAGTLALSPDFKTTQTAVMGRWTNAHISNGQLIESIWSPVARTPDPQPSTYPEFLCGIGPRIKPFEGSGRAAYDFVRKAKGKAKLFPKKPKRKLYERIIDDVVIEAADGSGRLFLKQERKCIQIGQNRWTFDSSGGAGFYLPDRLQPISGDLQSYGSEFAGVRRYDNAIVKRGDTIIAKFQICEVETGSEFDTMQNWHMTHEVYQADIFNPEGGAWHVDSTQDDVNEAPPVSLFSGASSLSAMQCRDAVVLPYLEDRDINYSLIQAGDTIEFWRAGL